jgi:peptide/nickel transport system substrate-binding protein
VLLKELPRHLGPSFSDIISIQAPSEREVVVSLKERSNFLQESLGFPIQAPNASRSGTGPFSAAERGGNELEMLASPRYYGTKPFIDRILVKSYSSVRAAWADLLRGNLDMLYEVGVDALASLEPSSSTKVFTFQRPYTLIVLLNVKKASLHDKAFRRGLNSAINRAALIDEVLDGRGSPATGPVSPLHWAFDPGLPHFAFEPHEVTGSGAESRFTILIVEPSHERMALALQRQLQSAGIGVTLEQVSVDEYQKRVDAGDFDAMLADAVHGPTMVRPALWWHSRGPLNWGRYSNSAVDAALEAINRAPDDAAYKTGVAAFQRAIVDDPPAIFLAWSERARAVSTRFEVPVEPGRDILSTLRLWRPIGAPALAKN